MPTQSNDHQAVEAKHIERMNEVAQLLQLAFPGFGFCLLVFDFERHDGRMNYISNAARPEMVTALREFLANMEGMGFMPPKEKQ